MRKVMLVVGPVAGLIVATVVAYEAAFWGRVWPGVRAAEISLGGLDREEAERAVEQGWEKIIGIELIYGTERWMVQVADWDLKYDTAGTVSRALNFGRSGDLERDIEQRWRAWRDGAKVDVVYVISENKLTETIAKVARQVNIPAQEPEVTKDEGGQIIVMAGENGQEVDERELKMRIRTAILQANTTSVEVPVIQIKPKLSDEQLIRAKERTEAMMEKKLTITFEEERRTWEVGEELVVAWLDPQGEGWKRGKIENWVMELAGTVDRPAQNAHFRWVSGGRVEEFRPAKPGYRVRQGEVVEALTGDLSALEMGQEKEKIMPLTVEKVAAEVTNEDVNDLGIGELLGRGESWYAGSITNRIFNLKKAADALNGVLVASGEVFSFNNIVGEVSAATGYKQAYIIKEGQTILGDGGGVCQTSSTLFRAILAAGLPIEERTAHAYRVSYYEQNYQVGFDATVWQPAPDLKFRNDTPGYVLIQTEFDEKKKYLAFLIYGTSDGRKVEISKSRMWEVIPPPPDLYIDDPNLKVGVVQQTEHKAYGAKVAFDWKVTRGEEVLIERTFYSNYRPWQAVYLRGTKTN